MLLKHATAGAVLLGALLCPAGIAHADDGAFHVSRLGAMAPGDRLMSVSASGPADVWAVGFQAYAELPTPIIIDGSPVIWDAFSVATQRWTGSAWRQQNPPWKIPGAAQVHHVSAATAKDVWVSGWSGADVFFEHWNGSSWTSHPIVEPSGAKPSYPFDITAVPGGTLWAYPLGAHDHVRHWTGSAWESTPIDDGIRSIVARSATDAWAVGSNNRLWHWDGRVWTVQPTPVDELRRTWWVTPALGPTGDLWLGLPAGYDTDRNFGPGQLFRLSDGKWTSTRLTETTSIDKVVVDGTNTPWILDGGNGIHRWDGSAFQPVTLPSLPAQANLEGITAVPGTTTIWAVGHYRRGTKETDISSIAITNG